MCRDAAALCLMLMLIWSARPAAYVDPGTGSVAYQLVLTAILAAGYGIRRLFSPRLITPRARLVWWGVASVAAMGAVVVVALLLASRKSS